MNLPQNVDFQTTTTSASLRHRVRMVEDVMISMTAPSIPATVHLVS